MHIFEFTDYDHENRRFQKKLVEPEHEYMNMHPSNYQVCYAVRCYTTLLITIVTITRN